MISISKIRATEESLNAAGTSTLHPWRKPSDIQETVGLLKVRTSPRVSAPSPNTPLGRHSEAPGTFGDLRSDLPLQQDCGRDATSRRRRRRRTGQAAAAAAADAAANTEEEDLSLLLSIRET